jgi:hypothetical protein
VLTLANGNAQISLVSIVTDLNRLEKWFENSLAYKDYVRLGLVNFGLQVNGLANTKQGHHIDLAESNEPALGTLHETYDYCLTNTAAAMDQSYRLCTLNIEYDLCKSYPALFIVPKETSDECVRRNTKCHRQNRYKKNF